MSNADNGLAAAALLAVATPGDWEQFVGRADPALLTALAQAQTPRTLPPPLVSAAVASDRPALRGAAAQNVELAGQPWVLDKLAEHGDTATVRELFLHRHWDARQRRAMLAAATRTKGWTGPGGLIPDLLTRTEPALLRSAVVCAFPDLVRRALTVVGPDLSRAEQLRALLSLHTHAGPDAVRSVLTVADLAADVVDLARAALTDPDGRRSLEQAVDAAENTATLISELRRIDAGRRGTAATKAASGGSAAPSAAELVGARTGLDWDLLCAEYARQPFTQESIAEALLSQWDSPPELMRAMLAAPPRTRSTSKWMEGLTTYALHAGVSGAELVTLARPAVAVLDVARTEQEFTRFSASGQQRQQARRFGPGWYPRSPRWSLGWAQFRTELQELVRDRLGADVAPWRSLRARLAEHTGSVAELLDTAVATAAEHRTTGAPWPDSGDLPDPRRTVSRLPAVRSAFLMLLEVADPAAHSALLPHLDDRTAHELVVTGSAKPMLAERIVTAGGARDRLVLARRASLDPGHIDRLLTDDDPELATSLFFQEAATDRQKLAVLVGKPFGAGRTGQRPLPPGLRDYLLGKRANSWTTPFALGCGDPLVARNLLRYVGVRPGVRRLRLMAGLWRRGGPDAVRALLDEDLGAVPGQRTKKFDAKLVKLLTELLAEADPSAALDRLRAHFLVALLRGSAASARSADQEDLATADLIAVELPSWNWDTVLAEHLREPLPPGSLPHLVDVPACPDELAKAGRSRPGPASPRRPATGLAALAKGPAPDYPPGRLAAGVEAREVLTDTPLDKRPWQNWADRALQDGLLRAEDLLRYGHPARRVLGLFPSGVAEPDNALLTELVAPIDGNLEAWLLALRLLPDFPGTITELIVTAERANR
ncbi:hypothetical protein GCM10022225_15550 [Plantactinospora mayteni]|uniref:DUF4132 domain-containing protein n=1 Tax=Plantactinospora mayteni TaxID=566021 RepID=A0ABQ4EG09_9ACTN|nr:hypothetical protein [Plantactinospora mayteni]GIG93629.1 hypothetical protein Pma05_02020 [Plantactinospora mayteni]